ncbi:MAG: hypothetical protein JKX68_00365 [Flavobacteriales bacterium]|nr:hypothetical protein [Flavobacteriales bacterium]
MKKYILFIIITGLSFSACNNPNQKEIGEVEALLAIIEETEKSLLSIDTSAVFMAKRQMDKDMAEISMINDTLTREEAFKLDDIFGSKKRLQSIMMNYPGLIRQIEFSKTQLNNLKQDLENGLVKKEAFKAHYALEQAEVMTLNVQVNKTIGGLDFALEKLKSDRPLLLELIENKKLKAADNE